jgi:hypothetical protein
MKKLATIVFISITLFACQKETIKPLSFQHKELNHDSLKYFFKDYLSAKRIVRSGKFASLSTARTKIPRGANVILVDFDGGVCSGTSWNVSGDINYAPANLTTDEQQRVLDSMQIDYAPFNIYITTSEQAYNNANQYKRRRLIFTTTYEWYGNSAGGVAYTGSFTWGDESPCWVFTSLLNYNVKSILEAGSHEAGHTLGLRHQAVWDDSCNLVSSYNYGYDDGVTSWAPIMGVGYDRRLTTWHIGPTSLGCNNIQDDKQIIASVVGYK